jgi:dihydroorotase
MIDPKAKWTLDATKFKSKTRNSCFHGTEVVGKAVATIVGGEVKMNLVG